MAERNLGNVGSGVPAFFGIVSPVVALALAGRTGSPADAILSPPAIPFGAVWLQRSNLLEDFA
jgi:hypothetical protein